MKANVIYSKASVERKPEYRQQTLILQDGERRSVRKVAVGEQAKGHIRQYLINLEKLTASLKPGHTVHMISCRENKDGSVDFPFLTVPTLGERLEGKSPEEYLRIIDAFCDALKNSFDTEPFEAREAFLAFFGVTPEVKGETALKVANSDLNFDNVFCEADGGYTIIDYEWVLPFPIPISYLIYRSLMLDPSFNAFSEEAQKGIMSRLGISEALEAQYHEMELAFLRYISPDEYKLDYFARIPGARQNEIVGFDYLESLPAENKKLSDDLSKELHNAMTLSEELRKEQGRAVFLSDELEKEQSRAVFLSGELEKEQSRAVFLSGELEKEQSRAVFLSGELEKEQSRAVFLSGELKKEQDKVVCLSDEMEKEQKENARISGELDRECREAVRLSGELKRELDVSVNLSRELAKQIDLYNEFSSKLWFRTFRKLGRGKQKLQGALRASIPQNSFLRSGWRGLKYLFRYGPAAFVQKLKQRSEIRYAEQRCIDQLADTAAEIKRNAEAPVPEDVCFSILVPLYNTPEVFLREMIQSVQDQTYSNWELCLADGSDSEHPEVGEVCRALAENDRRIVYRKLENNGGISDNTNACIDMATGDYIALFDHDDLLHPSALYENARVIHEQGAEFIYSDEIVFASPDREKLIATHFKPDYSPESLLSNNYICHLSVFKKSLLAQAGPFRKAFDGSQDHDIILRLTDCANRVVHIPRVLYLWRSHPTSVASDIQTKTYAITAGRNAVQDFLATRRHIDAVVESTPEYPTMYHVQFPIDRGVSVAVILDGTGLDGKMAVAHVEKLCERTSYDKTTFYIITDRHESESGTVLNAKAARAISWIYSDEENRAKRLNAAVKAAGRDYVVFLDADQENVNEDWVEQMLMFAQQDNIGAVGGKIYFTDQTLRQAGLILGLGSRRLVGRSHFRVNRENGGYFGQLAIAGDVSAVSLECMMVQRERFERAGGFDPEYRDGLFDVDLCLKLIDMGRRNVYTPFALFVGGQPGSRDLNYGAESRHYSEDSDRLRQVWAERLAQPDPYYNPNLTLDYSDYRVRA